MWQRIQTVFLALAAISLLVSLILPIWSATLDGRQYVLTAFYYKLGDVYQYSPYSLTAVLAIASATLASIEITRFKNRYLQMKLGALNSLFIAGTIGAGVYFASQLIKQTQVGGSYGLGLWLPGVAVVFNLLANRFIRRDERLVRDADRLR
jgi:hypothetical protein